MSSVCWYTWFLLMYLLIASMSWIITTYPCNMTGITEIYPYKEKNKFLKFVFITKVHFTDKTSSEWIGPLFKKRKKCVNCLFNSWCKCDNFTIRVCKKPLFNPLYEWTVYVDIYTEWIPEMKTHKSCLWHGMYYINLFSNQIIEFLEMCFVDQKSGY